MPFPNYHDPVLFTNFIVQAVAAVMSARQTDILHATRVREHLTSDKNIFQRIHVSETCSALR